MARTLATDVYLDGVLYEAGSSEAELAKLSTQVDAGDGKKPQPVSVADRITNPAAWVDNTQPAEPPSASAPPDAEGSSGDQPFDLPPAS